MESNGPLGNYTALDSIVSPHYKDFFFFKANVGGDGGRWKWLVRTLKNLGKTEEHL